MLPSWSSQTFYLLSQALLSIKLRIVQQDGTALPNNTELAPINNVLGSVFQDCKIFFNDKQISVISQCYNYKNYMESVLNYDQEVKLSWMTTQGYAEDTYTQFDTISGTNNG